MNSSTSPVWHPFTQHALRPRLPQAVYADGAYIRTEDGRSFLDAISSWWVITHGHRHPHIVAAVERQLAVLDQVIFAEFSHPMAELLAAKLLKLCPARLSRVFFSDSGSTSVEVALKMALGYWHHRGERRSRIVVMQHSYHGDTVGTMSVGARGTFTASYEALLFDVATVPFPSAGHESATLEALEALCSQPDTAAFIVEPLVLGAGGMLMYSADTLAQMRRICERHAVLFIADEVMTGWGRTGSRFACEQADVSPDILCSSKGLTGGLMPLAVTLCREEIYQAHYSEDRGRTFFHSSSFTGNPLACAAAVANLEIWENEPVQQRIEALSAMQRQRLRQLEDNPRLMGLRQSGTITAMEVKTSSTGYLSQIGPRLHAAFLRAGLLLRPLGNTIYVMPPYCVTEHDLDRVYRGIEAVLATLD